jgi:hypothetical protein
MPCSINVTLFALTIVTLIAVVLPPYHDSHGGRVGPFMHGGYHFLEPNSSSSGELYQVGWKTEPIWLPCLAGCGVHATAIAGHTIAAPPLLAPPLLTLLPRHKIWTLG